MEADITMRRTEGERFRWEARILKALAHESRLRIVDRLSEGGMLRV